MIALDQGLNQSGPLVILLLVLSSWEFAEMFVYLPQATNFLFTHLIRRGNKLQPLIRMRFFVALRIVGSYIWKLLDDLGQIGFEPSSPTLLSPCGNLGELHNTLSHGCM